MNFHLPVKPFFISRFSSYIATKAAALALEPGESPSPLISMRALHPSPSVVAPAPPKRKTSLEPWLLTSNHSENTYKGNRWKPLVMLCPGKEESTPTCRKGAKQLTKRRQSK